LGDDKIGEPARTPVSHVTLAPSGEAMDAKKRRMTASLAALVVIISTGRGLAEEDHIRLHPKGQRLVSRLQGPYANLPDRSVLAAAPN
jgi:hypothetical protein